MSDENDPLRRMFAKAKFEVIAPEDAEAVDVLVCAKAPDGEPLLHHDNVMDFCAECGCKVQHRPHAPKTPKRICMACAVKSAEAEGAIEVALTPKVLAEVKAFFEKQKKH